jgi:glucosamine-6-phosphate deaminase
VTDWQYDLSPFISFRDREACERVRAIRRAELTNHPNPDFRIKVVDDSTAFYKAFAEDLVSRIRAGRDEGRAVVFVLPVGPMPQYAMAARTINESRLSLRHVHTFNMDEYANENGVTAPVSWPGSFERAMWERFFELVDPELRPPAEQIHFPTTEAIGTTRRIEASAGPTLHGGIGWCATSRSGNPPGARVRRHLDAYKRAGARLVELHR